MSLKIIAITTITLALIATDVFAQANHNTSRSNQRPGGIAVPVDTSTGTSVNSDNKAEKTKSTGHVTLIKKAEGEDTNDGDVPNENSTNLSQAPANSGTDETTVRLIKTGPGNTANGYQALSLQGADTEADVTGNVTIQKGRIMNNRPSIDSAEYCAKFSEAELKAALEACESGDESALTCHICHL